MTRPKTRICKTLKMKGKLKGKKEVGSLHPTYLQVLPRTQVRTLFMYDLLKDKNDPPPSLPPPPINPTPPKPPPPFFYFFYKYPPYIFLTPPPIPIFYKPKFYFSLTITNTQSVTTLKKYKQFYLFLVYQSWRSIIKKRLFVNSSLRTGESW